MMATPLGPLVSLMFSMMFMLTLVRFSVALTAFVVGCAVAASLLLFFYRRRSLPRWMMDILDRFTDRKTLEEAYERRRRQLTVINADELFARLKSKVIGQDRAVRSIADQLRRRLSARRPDKPVAVFCLAGPPGVGKTHLAKALAEALYADKTHLHFFDMSQFAQPHAAASLFGQARGYVGSTSYGSLTAALRDRPDSIVLLDEFEKAHPEVHKRFLTAWNDGFVTETSDGARVPTDEAIFILTTNAASRRIGEIVQLLQDDPQDQDRQIKNALKEANFAPEVLSRIDEIFAFQPLQGLDIARVVALELEKLARQYGLEIAEGGIAPQILLDAIEQLRNRSDGGVRDIARALERQVVDGFIDARAEGAEAVGLQSDGAAIRVVRTRLAGEAGRRREMARAVSA
jgi:ATP-dependent Clp protease ATP-binding subunit ClpA